MAFRVLSGALRDISEGFIGIMGDLKKRFYDFKGCRRMIREFLDQVHSMWSKEGQEFSRGILGSFRRISSSFSDVIGGFRAFGRFQRFHGCH